MRISKKAIGWLVAVSIMLGLAGAAFAALPADLTGEQINVNLGRLLYKMTNPGKGAIMIATANDDWDPLPPPATDNYSLRWDLTTGLPFWGADADVFSGVLPVLNGGTGVTTKTGTGAVVLSTSPTLVTPTLGVAAATSVAATGAVTSSSPSAKIGYATGAGGLGAQATNKSTTVVMVPNPCVCGVITTDAEQLNLATAVSFTVTDSACATTDNIIVNHLSGGTVGAYTINAAPGSGSFVITIRNVTAGNLSEALLISFSIIKGATA